jgi:hypothetical protein
MDIRQPIVSALEAVGQAGVIDSEQMEGGGVQVMHMDRVLNDVVTEFIRLAVNMTPSDAGTG